jgi:hypothetical protein
LKRAIRALLLLNLLLATGCVPAEPPEVPSYFLALECGKPLPTTCGTRTRSYTQLPSRVGATTTRFFPALELPSLAELRPSRAGSQSWLAYQPRKAEVIDLDAGEDERDEPYKPGPGEPPAIGTMTEQAAQAKRLFDKAQWEHAVVALEAVALGAHGDDEGNRQIAEYHLAIANYNLKDYDAATDLFLLIVEDRSHHKFNEAGLWVSRLGHVCQTGRVLRPIAELREPGDDYSKISCITPNHLSVLNVLGDFLIARGLVELGEYDEAAKLYKPLRNDVDYGYRARQCLEWIEAQPKAPGAQ